jgi:serine/threonine protein kinase
MGMGMLRRRGPKVASTTPARGFTPLGEVESDACGVLIAARSEASGALVDIRVLTPALKSSRAFMRRLDGDMNVLREVRHTNLVSVMQFDRRAGAVVYESLPGSTTLSRLLHGHGPLEPAASLVLLEDCISGLEALHSAGVLHRNLTPDSVVVETTGAVLLRDAGLAGTPVTAGLLPGEQPYLAPEVLAGGPPTSAADLYAATAVFVESLGGRASKAAVRVDLRPLLTQGMAEDPSKRSATLDDFRHELDEYARATLGEGWRKDGRALLTAVAADQANRAVRVGSPAGIPGNSAGAATATVAALRSPGSRSPRVWVGLGTLGVAALIAALVLARSVSAPPGPSGGPGFFSNLLPFFNPPTATASPVAPGVQPGPSAGTNPPGTAVLLPIVGPTSTPTGLPPPPPTPTPNPALLSQTISWTSATPTAATYGQSYQPAASGGGSGNPVVVSSLTTAVCKSVAGTIDYIGVGACEIDATQAGNSRYNAAPSKTMSWDIGKASQSIAITSPRPTSPTYGGSYSVTASAAGGAVTFSADPSSAACSVSSTGAVSFIAAGTCVIDANQPGNADYSVAQQRQEQFDVAQAPQSITFTSQAPSCPCLPLQQYTVTANGGGSGNPVTFNIDPSSTPLTCSISGSTVTITGGLPGTCIIDAFQAGDANYSAAPEITQTIHVS